MAHDDRTAAWASRLRAATDPQTLLMGCGLLGIVSLAGGAIAFFCMGMDPARMQYAFTYMMNGAISLTYVIAILVLVRSRFGSRHTGPRPTDRDAR